MLLLQKQVEQKQVELMQDWMDHNHDAIDGGWGEGVGLINACTLRMETIETGQQTSLGYEYAPVLLMVPSFQSTISGS